MVKIRNKYCVPNINTEGKFAKPLQVCDPDYREQKPFERMYKQHTLSSARKSYVFKSYKNLVPNDDLDFILDSTYDHSTEIFPEKPDPYIQPETQGLETWRRLRNTVDVILEMPVQEQFAQAATADTQDDVLFGITKPKIPYKYHPSHPLLIGGITECRDLNNMQLMISTHHSPQTNAGYSRQDSDGTYFQY